MYLLGTGVRDASRLIDTPETPHVTRGKLFACVGGGKVEDMCYERRRAEACVD